MTTRRRLPTMSDVAAAAEVSATTVSYVLGGHSAQMRIAPETQERVRRAAAELRYRPNRGARNLRTSKSATVAVISDFVASGHFASEMLAGASEAVHRHGHVMLIGETEGDPDAEASLVEELLERRVDSFVYARLIHQRCPIPAQLFDQPLVLLNCVDADGRHAAVVPDERSGGRLAVRTLLAAGRTDRLYVVGLHDAVNDMAGPQRYEGITAELDKAGVSLSGMVECEWNVADAYEAVTSWLSSGVRPGGLICMNDRVGFGVYQALAEHGLRVAHDVDVISFDGTELASWMRPHLTSVALPFADLGATAVELLLRPNGPGVDVHHLNMALHVGASIGASRRVER